MLRGGRENSEGSEGTPNQIGGAFPEGGVHRHADYAAVLHAVQARQSCLCVESEDGQDRGDAAVLHAVQARQHCHPAHQEVFVPYIDVDPT